MNDLQYHLQTYGDPPQIDLTNVYHIECIVLHVLFISNNLCHHALFLNLLLTLRKVREVIEPYISLEPEQFDNQLNRNQVVI